MEIGDKREGRNTIDATVCLNDHLRQFKLAACASIRRAHEEHERTSREKERDIFPLVYLCVADSTSLVYSRAYRSQVCNVLPRLEDTDYRARSQATILFRKFTVALPVTSVRPCPCVMYEPFDRPADRDSGSVASARWTL